MSNKGNRPAPYSTAIRKSTRSSTRKSNSTMDEPSTSQTSPEVSIMPSGPSWEDFNKLQKSVAELTELFKKSVDKSRETSVSVETANACASGVQNVENVIDVTNQGSSVVTIPSKDDNITQGFNVNNPNSTDTVQSTINDYLRSFTTNSNPSTGEQQYYSPPGRPIDLKVTDKVKQKIWASEYVDLVSLLDPDQDNNSSFTLVSNDGDLRLAPNKSTKVIQSLGQWCSAFEIYLTIYCSKYPQELPKIMTYMNSVKTLAHRDGDYITYDKEFRYMKQTSNLQWDNIHTGLWLECRDKPSRKQNSYNKKNGNGSSSFRASNNKGNSSPKHPFGYCFRFHSFGKCGRSSCSYIHACYKCNDSPHSITRCPKAGSDTLQTNTKQDKQATNPNKSS